MTDPHVDLDIARGIIGGVSALLKKVANEQRANWMHRAADDLDDALERIVACKENLK